MDKHTATELAYKNGYAKGYADGTPKWIPVSERLPEIDKPCLCYKKRNGHTSYQMGTYIGAMLSGDCAAFKSIAHYGCIGVTHWMPMPMPPKGE